jgi:hypothetical protein
LILEITFFYQRSTNGVVVVPEELHQKVVGLRTRQRQIHPGVMHGHAIAEPLGQVDRRVERLRSQRVVVGQLRHLLGRRLDQRLLPEAQRSAPHTRHRLDVVAPLLVEDAHPLATSSSESAWLSRRGDAQSGTGSG